MFERKPWYRLPNGRLVEVPPQSLSAAAAYRVEVWTQNFGPRKYAAMIQSRKVGGFPHA